MTISEPFARRLVPLLFEHLRRLAEQAGELPRRSAGGHREQAVREALSEALGNPTPSTGEAALLGEVRAGRAPLEAVLSQRVRESLGFAAKALGSNIALPEVVTHLELQHRGLNHPGLSDLAQEAQADRGPSILALLDPAAAQALSFELQTLNGEFVVLPDRLAILELEAGWDAELLRLTDNLDRQLPSSPSEAQPTDERRRTIEFGPALGSTGGADEHEPPPTLAPTPRSHDGAAVNNPSPTENRAAAPDQRPVRRAGSGKREAARRPPSSPSPAGRSQPAKGPRDPSSANLSSRAPKPGSLLANRYRVVGSGRHTRLGLRFSARDELDSARELELEWIGPDAMASGSGSVSRAALALFCERRCELDHPTLNPWHACGDDPSRGFWFVRDVRRGRSLGELIDAQGPLPARVTARLIADIAGGLAAAEDLDLAHLDLTPDAISIEGRPGSGGSTAVLYDLGLAAMLGSAPESGDILVGDLRSLEFWAEGPAGNGRLVFTPAFAAPERVASALAQAGDGGEQRSDQFSLGLIAHLCLHGELPPSQADAPLTERLNGVARPGPSAGAPAGLTAAVARLLETEPAERFEDWHAVAQEFGQFGGRNSGFGQLAKLGKVAAILGVAGLIGGLAWRERNVSAADSTLDIQQHFVGPADPRIEFDQRELFAWLGDQTPAVRTPLGLETPTGEPLRGWKASWEGDSLVLEAPLQWPDGLEPSKACLVASQTGSRIGTPFELVWVGSSSWELADARLFGRELPQAGRARVEWSPDLELACGVSGPAWDLIRDVWLVQDEQRWPLEPPRPSADGPENYAELRVPLGRLLGAGQAPQGPFRGKVLARDVTGRESSWPLLLKFESDSLPEFGSPQPVAGAPGNLTDLKLLETGEYLFDPGRPFGLRWDLTQPAELAWELVTDDGRRFSRTQPVQPGSAVMLEGLGELTTEPFGIATLGISLEDSNQVFRPSSSQRGRYSESLELVTLAGPPSISALAPIGNRSPAVIPGKSLVRSGQEFKLIVVRRSAGPLVIEVSAKDAAGELVVSRSLEGLLDESTERIPIEIELPGEGRYEVQITTRRALPGDRGLGPSADPLGVSVTVDLSTPELVVRGLAPDQLFGPLDAPFLDLTAELVGESPSGSAVEIQWQLARLTEQIAPESIDGTPSDPSGSEPSPAESASEASASEFAWPTEGTTLAKGRERLPNEGGTWRVPLPFGPGRTDQDGSWVFMARAVDAAGHSSEPISIPFAVAVRGPQMEWIAPVSGALWTADPERLEFEVRVSASDPNGVDRLLVEVFDPKEPDRSVVAELARGVGQEYAGTLELHSDWSGKQVSLNLRGIDQAGADTERRLEAVRLGTVIAPSPPKLDQLVGVPVGTMRLVEGNGAFTYVFGGRPDDRENASFRIAELPPFNLDPRRSLPRGWQIEYAAGAIDDFLLDETEVTRGQFAEFVAAGADGYGRADLWPAGSTPRETRRLALALELSTQDPALPMTQVDWNEASAYAAWVGKRLPSWVEWEFAGRGERYRPYPAYNERAPLTPEQLAQRLHTGFPIGEAPSQARPAADPGDRCPETGILGLSGNVSEWTQTPAWFGGADRSEGPASHARRHVDALLRPGNPGSADEFWAAGGNFLSNTFDFSTAQPWSRLDRSDTRGFRCALSISEYRALELAGIPPPSAGSSSPSKPQ